MSKDSLSIDSNIVQTIQEYKLRGNTNVEILKYLYGLNLSATSVALHIASAFKVDYMDVISAAHWMPKYNDSDNSSVERALEAGIAKGAFAAEYLIPPHVKEELESHLLWLSTNGNSGHRIIRKKWDVSYKNLAGRNLSFCHLEEGTFKSSFLSGANFDCGVVRECNFQYCDLSRVSLNKADVSNSLMMGCSLWSANLIESHCDDVDFSLAILSDVSARGTSFVGANFKNAVINGGDFQSANFKGAKFSNCKLADSDIAHADFSGALLDNVDFNNCTNIQSIKVDFILVQKESEVVTLEENEAKQWLLNRSE